MSHHYHFVTRWRVEASCGEVADILGDPLALPHWWPAVYLGARETRPGDARGLGRRVALHTRGWLPYTLHWSLEVVDSRYPTGFTIVARGDLDGRGIWTIEQDGRFADVTYDWRVRAEKPLLRRLSIALKPLFEGNHRWAMAQGEESLRLELARRRVASDAARRAIPPPPGPVTYTAVGLIVGTAALAAAAGYVTVRAFRRTKSEI